jgi:hypothetical protein
LRTQTKQNLNIYFGYNSSSYGLYLGVVSKERTWHLPYKKELAVLFDFKKG